jgi:uncharacterized protein DUF3800
MPCVNLFADEAGDFKFKNSAGASRYFILCTIRTVGWDVGNDLRDLRRRMLLDGIELGDKFHAGPDKQAVRNEVFKLLQHHDFRIDATILEKRKAFPYVRPDEPTFYKYAWYFHAKYVIPKVVLPGHDLFISAAALETKKGKAAFKLAFNNVMQQTAPRTNWASDFPLSVADPCLQAPDYCAWAIQRKWEMNDRRSFDLIADKVKTEYDLWQIGTEVFY